MSPAFWLAAFLGAFIGMFLVESVVALLQMAAAAIVLAALFLRSLTAWALEDE